MNSKKEAKIVRLPKVMPPAERMKHNGGLVFHEGKFYARYACRLDRYLEEESITKNQHTAGIEIYQDFVRANMAPSLSPDMERIQTSTRHDWSESQLAARERFYNAYNSLSGKYRREVIWHVCVEDGSLRSFEIRNAGLRKGAAMLYLQVALEDLCKHYGFF